MIGELREAFEVITQHSALSTQHSFRVVVLSGEGPSFCAGADVNWMRASLSYSVEENKADAARMEAMFRTIDTSPVPVIAQVYGAALGGGCGLAAVSDIVIA